VQLSTQFDVKCPRSAAVEISARDETLTSLFPDAETHVVESDENSKTTQIHYTALGRSGVATFHFIFGEDGDVEFEKVCDGVMWQELRGKLSFRQHGAKTSVRIEMEGRTRPLVPEFTIKGAMREQLDQMAKALRARLEAG
jgi:hypothetical protein